jgi:hypothetical protein
VHQLANHLSEPWQLHATGHDQYGRKGFGAQPCSGSGPALAAADPAPGRALCARTVDSDRARTAFSSLAMRLREIEVFRTESMADNVYSWFHAAAAVCDEDTRRS